MSGTTSSADYANAVQDDVLAAHSRRQLAIHLYPHVLAPLRNEALCREHVLHLARANSKGKGAERAMCGGVAVAAHDRGTREREALLGTDNVDNALALVVQAKVGDAIVLDILLERLCLYPRIFFLDELRDRFEVLASGGRDILWSNVSTCVRF
jgi:hypothetical protein